MITLRSTKLAMENEPFEDAFFQQMKIFHGYVSLQEGSRTNKSYKRVWLCTKNWNRKIMFYASFDGTFHMIEERDTIRIRLGFFACHTSLQVLRTSFYAAFRQGKGRRGSQKRMEKRMTGPCELVAWRHLKSIQNLYVYNLITWNHLKFLQLDLGHV